LKTGCQFFCRRLSELGLAKDLLVGRGLMMDQVNTSMLGEAYEAILGAIYYDGGKSAVFKFFADTYTFSRNIDDNPYICKALREMVGADGRLI